MRTILLALSLVGGTMAQTPPADSVTGCISNGGALNKVALGSAPANPCNGAEKQVTWKLQNPSSTSGAFYIALTKGVPRIIAQNGPLQIIAKCSNTTVPESFGLR